MGKLKALGLAMAAAGAVAGLSGSGAAHHSTAMFAWGDEVRLNNMTVERWVWTNPHTFIYARDAEGNRWAFEGMSPNHLSREGWTRRTLAPGEKASYTMYWALARTDGTGIDAALAALKELGLID